MDERPAAERLADLHADGCLLLPNAWDAGSARVLEAAGFPALATTSAGIAFSTGRPDVAPPRRGPGVDPVFLDHYLPRIREVVESVAVPVSADLQDGHGDRPEDVAATIRLAVDAGVVGGNVEDLTGDPVAPLRDVGPAVERVRAAREAADAGCPSFVLVGRTDALLVGRGLDEAVRRANAYLAAGADCAFVPGAADAAIIATLVRELDGPLNVVMGLTASGLSLDDLRRLGVRRVTVGGSIARMLHHHLRAAAAELRERGTFTYAEQQVPQDDLNTLFGDR